MLSSNRRVEAGCMVLIIGARSRTDNVGKMGIAKKLIVDGDYIEGHKLPYNGAPVWLVEGGGLVLFSFLGTIIDKGLCLSRECNLLPIYPDEHKDEQHEQDRTLSKTR